MEMEKEIWKRLTKDLLMEILARLPMESIVRFRAVCKSWKEMFQSAEFRELVATSVVSSSEAFIIVQGRKGYTTLHSSEPSYVKNLWISIENGYKFRSMSLDFLPSPVVVVAACKSIFCCWNGKDKIYICNPLTQTWIKLPQRFEVTEWDFVSLAFDTCTARCTLIMGSNSTQDAEEFEMWKAFGEGPLPENFIIVEMYDSKTNKWTLLETTVDNLARPQGEGIYSNGRYYWLNELHEGDCLSIVAFEVEQKQWNVINGPQDITVGILSRIRGDAFVTGCEGRIVLVCTRHISSWELSIDEVEGEKWSPYKTRGLLPSSLLFCMDMAVNHSGCYLVFLPIANIFAVWSDEEETVRRIGFGQLADFSDYFRSLVSVRAFQVNNIFWP